MKKIIAILGVSLLLTMNITACTVGGGSKVIPRENTENTKDIGIRDQSQWQEYENSRFGYSIRFPKSWYKGNSVQNNDGILLHIDDSNFDIRVYGANFIEGISKPYANFEKGGFKKEDIQLNNGDTATLITGKEDQMAVYEMVFLLNDFEYHFYSKVSEEYAREYEDVILNVIKTFKVTQEAEEKEPSKQEGGNKTNTKNNQGTANNKSNKPSTNAGNNKPKSPKEIIKEREEKVIQIISEFDVDQLAEYVHPEKGLRFTPYTYVSLKNDLVFKRNQIANFDEDTNEYLWGYYDGSGFEIRLTPKEYWNKFVYDENFKNPDQKTYNEPIGLSSMIENQFTIYPDAIIVEYYMAPQNPDYGGMDWRSLRLVFEEYNGQWYLVGIIHNQHVV